MCQRTRSPAKRANPREATESSARASCWESGSRAGRDCVVGEEMIDGVEVMLSARLLACAGVLPTLSFRLEICFSFPMLAEMVRHLKEATGDLCASIVFLFPLAQHKEIAVHILWPTIFFYSSF